MGVEVDGLAQSWGSAHRSWVRLADRDAEIQRLAAYFVGHAYDDHRHDTYAIGVTISGLQTFNYRGERFVSQRSDVMIIHPDELHNGYAGTDQGFEYRMLYIQPHLIMSALDGRANELPFVRQPVMKSHSLLHAIVHAANDTDEHLEPAARDYIVATLADGLLKHSASDLGRKISATAVSAVRKVKRVFDEEPCRLVSSEEIERVAGMNRYDLARHFKRCVGTSPHRYIVMRRLEKARSAISVGVGLADAASLAGFSDQAHMTRHFKAAFGVTPGRWQRSVAL